MRVIGNAFALPSSAGGVEVVRTQVRKASLFSYLGPERRIPLNPLTEARCPWACGSARLERKRLKRLALS